MATRGRTHALPFSTGMMRSFGKRVARPCPTIELTTSVMVRLSAPTSAVKAEVPPVKGRNSSVQPSQSLRNRWKPLSDECIPTSTSASCTASQNGSNSGRAKERRRPLKSGTGAGRIRIALAPWSSTQRSSSRARSTMGSVITGVGKIRPS